MNKQITARDIHISHAVYKGQFIFVKQFQRDIYVVCVPDENEYKNEKSIYILTLNESMYVTDLTEIKLPLFNDIYISKMYQDVKSGSNDFIICGSFLEPSDDTTVPKLRIDFKIKNYTSVELSQSKKTTAGNVYDFVLEDIYVDSISKKGERIHIVGHNVYSKQDVYIQFDDKNKKINQELSFFSDEGPIVLKELCCTNDNEVILVGYVETKTGSIAYINKIMTTGIGATTVD